MPCYSAPPTRAEEIRWELEERKELECLKENVIYFLRCVTASGRDGGINKFIQQLDYNLSGLELRNVAYWVMVNLDVDLNMGNFPKEMGQREEVAFLEALLCSLCRLIE